MHKYRLQILLVIGLRIVYSVWLAVVWLIVGKWYPQTEKARWETYYHLTPSSSLLGRAFIDVWLRWDAVHYMNIAQFGYKGVGIADTVFFPVYPYLVGIIARITVQNVTLIGLLVSTLAALFAVICLRKLVVDLFHDEELANWSSVVIAVYPTAFFLHAPFTDALFLACEIACILLMVKHQHIFSGLIACIAGGIRPQAVLLLIPMIVYLVRRHRKGENARIWSELLAVIMAPLGFGAFTLWRQTYSEIDIIQSMETFSRVRFQLPFVTLWQAMVDTVNHPEFITISEFVSVMLFLGIFIWMCTRQKFRKHTEIMLYSFATWLLITSKTTITASILQSSNRYVLHLFFVFIGIAVLLLRVPAKIRGSILLFNIVLGMVCATLYALWIFVG